MPSPAAGKSADAPRTPTKLGRKPQSQRTPKLGEQAEKATEATSQKPDITKPTETDTPDLPPRPSEGDVSEKVEGAKKTAEDAPKEASGAASEVGEQDPTGKVSEATGDLKEQVPKPIDDEEDVTAGAELSDDDNATEKAGDLGEEAEDTAEDTAESAQQSTSDLQEQAGGAVQEPKKAGGGVLSGAKNLAGRASSLASKSSQDPTKAADSAKDTVEGAAGDVEDTAGDATEGVEDTAGDATEGVEDTAGDVTEGAEDTAGGAVKDVQDTTEDLGDEAEDATGGATDTVEGAVDGAKDTVDGAKDTAEEAAEGAKDAVEDTTGQELPDVANLSLLKGLEIQGDGSVLDKEGNQIGKLVEGDAEDLEGYSIGDDGEILDDDGDLVGRCELLPEKIDALKKEAQAAAEGATEGKLPDISILKGLTVNAVGEILNDDGDTVGQIVEGDISELKGREVNEKGEILDDEGNVIGRAKVHPDAAGLVDAAEGELDEAGDVDDVGVDGATDAATGKVEELGSKADEAGEAVDSAVDQAGSTVDKAKSQVEDEVPDLPGVEALEGHEINSEGEIVDDEGNVLGQVAEGVDIEKVKGLTVNENGEVVDEEGNVLGKVELAEGAAEHLKEQLGPLALDIRILEGLKVNKKGKVLNEEGDEIGELTEGDVKDAAGKTINDKGEVLDKKGNVIGKVEIIPGEAAEEATKELRERLAELEGPKEFIPDLDILEGLKVNKKGKVLNEDGDEIGELVQGELSECAGKKLNEKGEVLDKDGNIIGRVRVLPQEVEEAAEEGVEGVVEGVEGAEEGVEEAAEGVEGAQEDAEGAVEEAGEEVPELPPLSILEGLSVNKAGKIVNDEGTIVGELIEGDAKKLSKLGATADAEGQFWDNKGNVIGRAQTVAVEEDEEGTFAGLEGLIVVKDGKVEDENGNVVGVVVEGDAKKLVGRAVDEDGDIIDKKGSVIGHAERYEEPEPEVEPEEEPIDLSILTGRTVNKQGNVIGDEGVPIGRLVEGNPKEVSGRKISDEGQIWNDAGKIIGRVELIPEHERETKPEGPFAGLEDLRVVADGNIADEDGNIVGRITEGNPKRLIGLSVDEDGDIIDKYGNVKGHAEPLEEEPEEEAPDLSILDNKVLNKQGFVVDENGVPLGRLVEGNVSELAGRRCDELGQIHNDTGKVVGRCEVIPENERVAKPEGPFAGLEGLRVVADGKVEDADGNVVGEIVEGNPKRLIGLPVDEDGDIIDKYGNVKGHAEPWEAEEEQPEDLSALAGCTVNKAGNVVDSSGTIIGRVVEGDPQNMIGNKVDSQGQIWDNAGNVIGRAELAKGVNTKPEGPFSGFENITVAKDETVVTPDGTIVGRLIEGDVKKLVGHKVDEEGEIIDKNGNLIGKAERWEPEEKERRINPMAGRRVNREGEVRDEDGNVMGRLTAGDLGHCAGLEIDDNGYVVDNDGNKVGEVTLLENIVEEEEEGLTEEELEELRKRKEDAELADKMANICQQTLERVQPVCKQITEYIEAADRTPREELDEEELVNNVKPLIEEAGRILQECNGSLRGLDPDGRIAAQAKGRAGTREATPEEYRLADCLKELTTTVVTTIDNAKKKIADMPHAKKKLNPLWALLTEPLFQIIAAVGLLLSGVLGLVGRLLNGLGLGGLVNGLLGGLGINKLLSGLGLGSISEALGGKKDKKKSGGGAKGLPLIGGMFGGK
ncbi:Lea domain protein [Neofusicoccum parvum]|uniref:Lea domain protein n=1 Tax=Neofusicoccum parvum TaxID=310453 RepID=A0ACB5RPE4_9PEZI|nr:Lea domain protein [Neofusicoccum parvum]